jgi:two-component system sensor histidine kinase KdpD
LQTESSIEGVLQIALTTSERAHSLHAVQSLVSMANLASAFLENQRLFSTAIKAESLQEVDRLKTTLISSVSHELKTPLAAITATLTNLLAEDVEWSVPRMREELRYADANVERLHDNIGALLDFARLESADWKTQFDWYELDDLLGIVRERLLESERARLVLTIAEGFPPLYIDCQQMTRAIQHLLENALSYAPADSPIIIGGSTTAQEIRLWIEDAGPGIPAEERVRIFEKFYRGSASSSAAQGTGLGLAIAAEIVRNHHGRLWVEDVHPHGARFVMAISRFEEE